MVAQEIMRVRERKAACRGDPRSPESYCQLATPLPAGGLKAFRGHSKVRRGITSEPAMPRLP
jgi:hypothetical protein